MQIGGIGDVPSWRFTYSSSLPDPCTTSEVGAPTRDEVNVTLRLGMEGG